MITKQNVKGFLTHDQSSTQTHAPLTRKQFRFT